MAAVPARAEFTCSNGHWMLAPADAKKCLATPLGAQCSGTLKRHGKGSRSKPPTPTPVPSPPRRRRRKS